MDAALFCMGILLFAVMAASWQMGKGLAKGINTQIQQKQVLDALDERLESVVERVAELEAGRLFDPPEASGRDREFTELLGALEAHGYVFRAGNGAIMARHRLDGDTVRHLAREQMHALCGQVGGLRSLVNELHQNQCKDGNDLKDARDQLAALAADVKHTQKSLAFVVDGQRQWLAEVRDAAIEALTFGEPPTPVPENPTPPSTGCLSWPCAGPGCDLCRDDEETPPKLTTPPASVNAEG